MTRRLCPDGLGCLNGDLVVPWFNGLCSTKTPIHVLDDDRFITFSRSGCLALPWPFRNRLVLLVRLGGFYIPADRVLGWDHPGDEP